MCVLGSQRRLSVFCGVWPSESLEARSSQCTSTYVNTIHKHTPRTICDSSGLDTYTDPPAHSAPGFQTLLPLNLKSNLGLESVRPNPPSDFGATADPER
eukprot:scaffold115825_cov66-Phaeocystis_antarctica.AAC.4